MTSLKPIFSDFEALGVYSALERSLLSLKSHADIEIPRCFFDTNFESAVLRVDGGTAAAVVTRCRALEQKLMEKNGEHLARRPRAHDHSLLFERMANVDEFETRACGRRNLALARVAIGAVLEAVLIDCALQFSLPGQVFLHDTSTRHEDRVRRFKLARLYSDSFKIALWTSVHVGYVGQLNMGVETPPPPSIFGVPSSATEIDWSDLFARRFLPRQIGNKSGEPLLNLLMRCTNPGSRGWDALLKASLEESQPNRIVMGTSTTITMTGMHEALHPAARPHWSSRAVILALMHNMTNASDFRKQIVATSQQTKELLRRTLASSISTSPAAQRALSVVSHPVGLLTLPPHTLPHRGLEGAMSAFVTAALDMCVTDATFEHAVKRAFALHDDAALGEPPDADDPSPHSSSATLSALATRNLAPWNVSWLGKGTASIHQKIPLVRIAADLWAAAFRSNFIVYWCHAMTHKYRLTRLDTVPYRALHEMNSCTQLVSMLSEKEALRAQRVALTSASSGIYTIEEIAALLGIRGMRGGSSNGGAKNVLDALNTLSVKGTEPLALMLSCARVAWVSEELLVVDLGKRTAVMQIKALCRRLHIDEPRELSNSRASFDVGKMTKDMPDQATNLLVCTECRRVGNATCDIFDSSLSFNELGVSCAMLRECCRKENSHIRCSKRSSAALRSAISFQDTMETNSLEELSFDSENVDRIINQTKNAISASAMSNDSGVAARIRRDAKSALEQRERAEPCGSIPMLKVSLVGRAVRIFGSEWYGLCAFCGCVTKIAPQNRLGGEICCLRCDPSLLNMKNTTKPKSGKRICRFCGREEEETPFKIFRAPHDVAGDNASLPVPLRTVAYCAKHNRTWLNTAHRALHTRVILSHIATGAKPVFSTEKAGAPGTIDHGPKRKRRRSV